MKKFFSFLAAAAMLFTASCSNDDLGAEGDEAVISFSMNLNGVSSTKAIADGLKVDKLFYSVFEAKEANGETTYTHLHTYPAVEGIQFPYNLDIRLAKGKAYRVVFWAQDADCQAYTYTNGNVTVNYVGDNNDETRDAFCGYRDVETVTGSVKLDATLKRPFAQLNVGVTADDWTAAKHSGVDITVSKVTIDKVANQIDLVNDKISGEATNLTYTYGAIPTQMLGVDLNGDKDTEDAGEQFNYLSMSYLLVEENEDVNATFTFSTAEQGGHEIAFNVPVTPLQRNHRTNILGQILTGTVTFEIKIDANFDGDIFAGPIKVVKTADELQAALDAANENSSLNTIILGADITGDVIVSQRQNVNIEIDGRGYKFDGTINVHGNSRLAPFYDELVIKNINFETSTDRTFIWSDSQAAPARYAHNVTIENCTFTATGAAVDKAVAIKFRQMYGLTVKGCTATNMHTLLQAQYTEDPVIVENVTSTGNKGGISFTSAAKAMVAKATVNTKSYGIRFGGERGNAELTVKDCNIEAYQPVIIRYMTAANNTFKFEGTNTLTTTELYQIVITNGKDDVAYSTPTGTYTLTGADDFIVYPKVPQIDTFVSTAAELTAALADSNVKAIYLRAGEYGTIVAKSNKTIYAGKGAKVDAVNLAGADNLTLMNIEFDAAKAKVAYDGKGNGKQWANILSGDANKNGSGSENLVIDGCTFAGTFTAGGVAIAFTDQGRGSGQSGNITIKNCKFNTTGGYYDVYAHYSGKDNMVIENNTFNSVVLGQPIYLGRYQSNTPVVVKGNAFNKVDTFENAAYIQAHSSSYTVSFDASNNTFAE